MAKSFFRRNIGELIGVNIVVFFHFIFPQMVNARIDADPVEPRGKIRIVLSFEFIEGVVRFDERFLKDVFGIFFVFGVLEGERENSAFVFLKELPECVGVALLSLEHDFCFIHSVSFINQNGTTPDFVDNVRLSFYPSFFLQSTPP